MDAAVVETLTKAGIWSGTGSRDQLVKIHIPLASDDLKQIVRLEDRVPVLSGEKFAEVTPKPIRELFVGKQQPPKMEGNGLEAYLPFLMLLESTAADYCSLQGKPLYDSQFEKLYADLRRRPDGKHPHVLSSYLRAAAQVYLSLTDTSEAEFDAVMGKLVNSARRWSAQATSTNYWSQVLQTFIRPTPRR